MRILKEEGYHTMSFEDSWTSIYDIGRVYQGKKFTYRDYLETERKYVRLFQQVFHYLNARTIKLKRLYKTGRPKAVYDRNGELRACYDRLADNASLSIDDLRLVVPMLLREDIHGVLYHRRTRTYIHFGYDYYEYIVSPVFYRTPRYQNAETEYLNPDIVRMVKENGLFMD